MKIHFIRHGQSKGNVDVKEYYNKADSDVELTEKGKQQSREAGTALIQRLTNGATPIMIHSPYIRARDTADEIDSVFIMAGIIAERYENPCIYERMWGSLRDIVNARSHTPEHFRFYYRPDRGESYADVYIRLGLFFSSTVQPVIDSKRVEDLIVVTHGDVIKVAKMILKGQTILAFEADSSFPKNCEIFTHNV